MFQAEARSHLLAVFGRKASAGQEVTSGPWIRGHDGYERFLLNLCSGSQAVRERAGDIVKRIASPGRTSAFFHTPPLIMILMVASLGTTGYEQGGAQPVLRNRDSCQRAVSAQARSGQQGAKRLCGSCRVCGREPLCFAARRAEPEQTRSLLAVQRPSAVTCVQTCEREGLETGDSLQQDSCMMTQISPRKA